MSNADNPYIAQILKGVSTESLQGELYQDTTWQEEGIERKICTGTIQHDKWL